MLSGIRDLWIVLFCLMERTLLQILLAVPVPVRMVLVGVLVAKYVGCLFCTSLSMTILTVVMTAFVATNIKKWNAEFQIIYVTARLRKRSRQKAYNFRINYKIYGQPERPPIFLGRQCTVFGRRMSHGLYQVWVEIFRGRECTTFGFILVHFLYRKWNRKTDTQKWNNDVPKQSQTCYNDCTKKERTGYFYICVPICAQD